MAKVTWDELARQNQKDILAYGARTWGKNAARKMHLHIKTEVERLSQFPLIGKVEPLLQGRILQFHSLVIHEHYKLVYHYDEAQQLIRIAALWDTRREPRAQAEEMTETNNKP